MYILGSYVSLSLLLDMEKYDLTRRSRSVFCGVDLILAGRGIW